MFHNFAAAKAYVLKRRKELRANWASEMDKLHSGMAVATKSAR